MAAATYRLTVDGELSEHAARAFDGLTLTREDGRTVLTGLVRDQAELQGHLQRVSDLGMTLLSATPVTDDAQSAPLPERAPAPPTTTGLEARMAIDDAIVEHAEAQPDSGTTNPASPAGFSSAEITELLSLMKDSDSVELKLTVPETHQRSAVAALEMDPLAAQIRQVFFFDTAELALDHHGVVVRARRVQGKGDDSVVKLRPVVPSELPKDLRKSAGFRVEVDALPGGFVCSGTLKGAIRPPGVRHALAEGQPVRSLFSKEQQRFFAAHAPSGISLEDLDALGPIFVLKLPFAPKELGRKLVAEMWIYPDGSRILELSTRCAPDDAFQRAAELRGYLAVKGIEVSGEQETKTRKALAYFAGAAKTTVP